MRFDFQDDAEHIIPEMFEATRGLPSGIQALDDAILGFSPGELVVIAGRTSEGKSSLLRDIALSVGKTHRILFFALEMSCKEVRELCLFNLAKLNYHNARRGGFKDVPLSRLEKACAQLSTCDIVIEDDNFITPQRIHDVVVEEQQTKTVDCIIVDYLQLMSADGTHNNREQEMASVSKDLKAVAKEFNVPVIAACQLNKNMEYRESTIPRLSDLRESAAIGHNADKVIMLHRPSYDDRMIDASAEDTGVAKLIVIKQRSGPSCVVDVVFINEWASFCDVPDEGDF